MEEKEKKEKSPLDAMWTEKYRPKKVNDVIGIHTEKIKKYLENPKSMPHFLFYSKTPGTGKTTLAKAIINELGCDSLILNSSDDRKIDVIRNKVKEFSITKSSKQGLRRVVFLDEFDGMLKASQNALRNLMETYSSNVFFILTCNNINKVIDALKSRCVPISFARPEKEEIYNYLESICQNENLDYTEEGLHELIKINYPSIRNCVLALQDLYTMEEPVTKQNVMPVNDQQFGEYWDLLKKKDWKGMKTKALKSDVDVQQLNTYLWERALETNDQKLIQITCKNERDMSWGADPKVIFITSLIEMVK